MDAYEAVREAAKKSGVPLTHIGPAMGKPSTYVNNGMTRGSSPQAKNLAAMLSVCGYSLCAVPHPDVPESALMIDPAE